MPATATGHGAQVVLSGDAQAAARGVYTNTLPGNSEAMAALVRSGTAPDGSTADGSTLVGGSPDHLATAQQPATGTLRIFAAGEPAGTDLTSLGWVKSGSTGTVTVSSTGALTITQGAGDTLYSYETSTRVHYVEAEMVTNTGAGPVPMCVRCVDANNFVGIRVNVTQLDVLQRVAGTFTTLFSLVASASIAGVYRLEARGDDTWALYFAGSLLATGAIPSVCTAATKVGICGRNTTVANAIDNLHVFAGKPRHGHAAGTWTWWHEPRAVSASGKTWFGYNKPQAINSTINTGRAAIAEINHTTGLATQYTLHLGLGFGDDHCYPTILVRPDGRLIAFYCEHLSNIGIYYRISVNVGDASAWGAESIFMVPPGTGGDLFRTYPSPVMLSAQSNRIYVFFRGIDSGLCVATSDNLATATAPASDGAVNGTVTWSTITQWAQVLIPAVNQKGVYHKIWSDGVSRIDFVCTNAVGAEAGTKTDIRHFYYDGTTARLTDGGPMPAFAFKTSDMTPIATSGAPDNYGDVWVQDFYRNNATGRMYVVFTRFLSEQDHRYYYAVYNGVTWSKREIPGTSCGPLTQHLERYYSPGICLDSTLPGVLYLSLGGSDASKLYRYATTDEGVTWTRRLVSPPDEVNGVRYQGQNFRPVVPRNRADSVAVLWCRGLYEYYDQTYPTIGGGYHCDIMAAPLLT